MKKFFRKSISLILAFSLIVSVVPSLGSLTANAAFTVTGKASSNVTVRSSKSTSASAVTTLSSGVSFELTAVSSDNSWYKIKTLSSQVGYVLSSEVKLNANYRTTGNVNLRKSASASSDVLSYVLSGTDVTVIGSTGGWYKVVTSSNQIGYMGYKYLQAIAVSTGKYQVTASSLKLYKSPTLSANSFCTLPKYYVLSVTDVSNALWYKVKLSDGKLGYAQMSSLTRVADSTALTPAGTSLFVTKGNVYLRSGTNSKTTALGIIQKNTIVSVTDTSNANWYKVTVPGGKTGYIASRYLTKTAYSSSISTATATPKPTATPTPKPTATAKPTATPSSSSTKYKVTATSGLNLRKSASTSSAILETLSYGSIVTLVDAYSSSWYKVKSSSGNVGYVSTEYIEKYNGSSGGSDNAGSGTIKLPRYQSYYLGDGYYTSSDTSIATVNNGFVYGKKQGTCTVGGKKFTVTAPEAVRYGYTSPNAPVSGNTFNFVAVTDASKTAVKFVIQGGSTYSTTSYTTEKSSAKNGYANNTTRIWKKSAKLSAGNYTVKVYSKTSSGWSSSYYTMTVHVTKSSATAYTTANHYASDKILNIIANFEGYVPCIEDDPLTSSRTPTLGYGHVVYKGQYFYNNLTKTEAYAMLCDTVNAGYFTSSLNSFVSKNSLQINQAQWDALLSLSYNIGTGWLSGTDTADCLLHSPNFKNIESKVKTSSISATVVLSGYAYTSSSTSSTRYSISAGQTVKVYGTADKTSSGGVVWYKMRVYAGGKTRTLWTPGNLKFPSSVGYTKNLRYIDSTLIANNLLQWHSAGGVCITGLVWRRLSEAKIFLYGEYATASYSAPNYQKNTYKFIFPSCVKRLENY